MPVQTTSGEGHMPRTLKPGHLSPEPDRPGGGGHHRMVVWGLVAMTVVSSVWLMFGAPI